jgi:hypothetical protein
MLLLVRNQVARRAASGPVNEHNPHREIEQPRDRPDTIRPTRHRRTQEELYAAGLKRNINKYGPEILGNLAIRKDPAWTNYVEYRDHSEPVLGKATAAARLFLTHLNKPTTETALSELIAQVRKQHREDDYSTDRALRTFSKKQPETSHSMYAGLVKGIFKANSCPLTASIKQPLARKEKRISAGILKAVYDSLPREELRLLADFCAFTPERVSALCKRTPISAWEESDNYTIIRFDPAKCKVKYEHIGIMPRQLADRIRSYAKDAGRGEGAPFPNHETLWREITKHALNKFGIRLTSKYCRKEYVAKAKKTPMPPNDWDFLAGHKQKVGNQAHHYDPEDDDNLIKEYDRYLAPYLGLGNTREPDEAADPFRNPQFEQLQKENQELKEQILKLTKLLTERLTNSNQ